MTEKLSTISPGLAPDYSTAKAYAVDDVVLYHNAYWRCATRITGPKSWYADDWDLETDIVQNLRKKTDMAVYATWYAPWNLHIPTYSSSFILTCPDDTSDSSLPENPSWSNANYTLSRSGQMWTLRTASGDSSGSVTGGEDVLSLVITFSSGPLEGTTVRLYRPSVFLTSPVTGDGLAKTSDLAEKLDDPGGGTVNQVLTKTSSGASWQNPQAAEGNYNSLTDRPKINGVIVAGDHTVDYYGGVKNNDYRLNNERPPTPHAQNHATGGTDALTPAAIGAASLAQLGSKADKTDLPYGYGTSAPDANNRYQASDGKITYLTGLVKNGVYKVVVPCPAEGKVTDVLLRIDQPSDGAASVSFVTPAGSKFYPMDISGGTMAAGKKYVMSATVYYRGTYDDSSDSSDSSPNTVYPVYDIMFSLRELTQGNLQNGEGTAGGTPFTRDAAGNVVVDSALVNADGTMDYVAASVNADGSVTVEAN